MSTIDISTPTPTGLVMSRTFDAPKVVSTSRKPNSRASGTGPSTPPGSRITRPSIWKPPQMPSTGLPDET